MMDKIFYSLLQLLNINNACHVDEIDFVKNVERVGRFII